jgi:Chemotaxis phosphatase CheX
MSSTETEARVDLSNAEEVKQLLAEMTTSAMQTMAFFCTEPTDASALAPEDSVLISMGFSGSSSGTVEFVAGKFFGQRLASNALGCGPTDEEALTQCDDSIRELVNVVVGMMMPRLAHTPGELFALTLPSTRSFDENEWDDFVAQSTAAVLDAEGDTIAIRVVK